MPYSKGFAWSRAYGTGIHTIQPKKEPKSRVCPKCEAQPGQSCTRVTAALRDRYGTVVTEGYTIRLKNVHKERKVAQ